MNPTQLRKFLALPGMLMALVAVMLSGCITLPTTENGRTDRPPTLVPTFTPEPATPPGQAFTTTTPLTAPVTAQAESAVLLPTVTPTPAPAAFDPAEVQLVLQPVIDGLDRPVFVTHAGDSSGRLFIVEKGGTVRILRDGLLQPEPFLDITEQVSSSGNEQGLLGLAFAPTYAQRGWLFVNYTGLGGDTIVERYRVSASDPDRVDPISASTVITLEDPARNHNGGMLAFGPDGQLWIGLGDGGGARDQYGNGQNPQTLLGKMLRLDVTTDPSQPYLIPPDNPWVAADWNGADVRDEIWAIGLRNPWRYSFDRQSGDLWIADVGQNQYEEVNYIPAGHPGGLNFGWPLMEGQHCTSGQTCDRQDFYLPVAEYDHSGHCSVTGGYVYRGSQFPELQGLYFYGDYCSGVIWAMWPDGQGGWNNGQLLDSDGTISSFGEDEAGELYVTDLSKGTLTHLAVSQP